MCTLKLPIGVIENIDRARKQCLWRGNDAKKKVVILLLGIWYTNQNKKEAWVSSISGCKMMPFSSNNCTSFIPNRTFFGLISFGVVIIKIKSPMLLLRLVLSGGKICLD